MAVDESSKGGYTFLGCNIAEGELSFRNYERVKNMLKNYVAQMLAEHIVSREEKTLIRKTIARNYYYFSEQERAAIYDNAIKLMNSESFHDFHLYNPAQPHTRQTQGILRHSPRNGY